MSDLYLPNKLTTIQKQNFYKSVENNNLELFVSYIIVYGIFEEVSQSGNNWTVFHYAINNGKIDIINFCLEYLYCLNLKDKILKIKTNDNKCPILCLLDSKELNDEQKKGIYFKIILDYKFQISNEVLKEAYQRNFYEVKSIKKCQNDSLLKNELRVKEKMEFYNSVIDDDLELFKSYIVGNSKRKPYSIFEEVSAQGYNWTTFHYAMHYGRWNIIKFIIEYLIQLDKLNFALSLKTNDKRCPLLCLLKSNHLKNKEKKNILSKIISSFHITLSNEVEKEIYNRKMDEVRNKEGNYQ